MHRSGKKSDVSQLDSLNIIIYNKDCINTNFFDFMKIDRNFSIREAEEICELLISGNLETEKIIEILKDFQDKGETVEEIAGFAKAIVSKAQKIPFDAPTIDLCGTGGSKFDRFNVSTSVAFIVGTYVKGRIVRAIHEFSLR